MAECATSQVAIQWFKLKKSMAPIILLKKDYRRYTFLDILEEDGKRENRRGKTRGWIRIKQFQLRAIDIKRLALTQPTNTRAIF